MKRGYWWVLLVGLLVVATVSIVGCSSGGVQQSQKGEYQYITAVQLKEKLEKEEPVLLFDIQVEEEWQEHRIIGSIPTYSYPVESEADLAKIEPVLPDLAGDAPVVVVCPRGGGGAERAYDYLKENGIAEDRLLILEKGMAKWPFGEFVESDA